MKQIISILLLIALLVPSARADVIIEPENVFYSAHQDEITYLPRRYEANGSSGWVCLVESPNLQLTRKTWTNGTVFSVNWYYNDGSTTWGLVDDAYWIDLSQCLVVYDYLSFEQDYGTEFKNYSSDELKLCDYIPATGEVNLVLYSYPGSEGHDIFTLSAEDLDWITFTCSWTDENGYLWGFIGYLYGYRNMWICLDHPSSSTLPTRTPVIAERIPPKEPGLLERIDSAVWPTAGLVLLVAAGTAVLIWRRKKETKI